MTKFKGFLLIFSIVAVALAQERELQGIRISLFLEEREEVSPDVFRLDISLRANGQKESEVINILGSVDKAIRDLKVEYSGGRYWVEKNCWWEKEKRRCSGYTGTISYSFRLDNPSKQNEILEALDHFKSKLGEAVSYSVSNSSWVVSEKKIKGVEEDLRLKLIDRAKDFAEKASKRLGKNCSIQSIRYEPSGAVAPLPFRALKTAKVEAPEPAYEDLPFTIKAFVDFVCK